MSYKIHLEADGLNGLRAAFDDIFGEGGDAAPAEPGAPARRSRRSKNPAPDPVPVPQPPGAPAPVVAAAAPAPTDPFQGGQPAAAPVGGDPFAPAAPAAPTGWPGALAAPAVQATAYGSPEAEKLIGRIEEQLKNPAVAPGAILAFLVKQFGLSPQVQMPELYGLLRGGRIPQEAIFAALDQTGGR